jgi:hypothetical protein
VQRLVSVVKMATVLEEYTTYYRRAAFCCPLLCAKGLNAKDIHRKMFPVYGGKCLSRKAVHNCVANVSLMTKRLKRRRRQSKDFCAAGFDTLVNRRNKCIIVVGGCVEK